MSSTAIIVWDSKDAALASLLLEHQDTIQHALEIAQRDAQYRHPHGHREPPACRLCLPIPLLLRALRESGRRRGGAPGHRAPVVPAGPEAGQDAHGVQGEEEQPGDDQGLPADPDGDFRLHPMQDVSEEEQDSRDRTAHDAS
jgi:hypothetical protein